MSAHSEGKWTSKGFYGLAANYGFYPICKGAVRIPRPSTFKDICVLWAKNRKEVSANASGIKINLEVEVKTNLTMFCLCVCTCACVCVCVLACAHADVEVEQSPFSLFPRGRWGGGAWTTVLLSDLVSEWLGLQLPVGVRQGVSSRRTWEQPSAQPKFTRDQIMLSDSFTGTQAYACHL